VALISQFVFQFVDVFQPMITNLAYRRGGGSGEAPGVTDVAPSFLLLMKTSVLLGWGPTLMLWLAGRQILVFWVGDVGAQAGDLLIALTFAFGWNFIGHAAGLILLSTARHQLLGVMAIVGSSLNVLLSLLFTLQFGLLGVAIGTIIVMGVTEMIILPVYTCRLVGLPLRTYVVLVLRAALSLLVAYAVGTAASLATSGLLGEWGSTFAACLSGGLVFLVACWGVLLTAEEREMLLGVARGLLRRG
jgi:O-antigen/teichoic acid export membrane protein